MFAADYYGAPHSNVLKALSSLGESWQRGAYGGDTLTRIAQDAVREKFGLVSDAGVFFVPTGTAGNLLATAALIPHPWQALMCATDAHMTKYEAGGPESRGHKIISLPHKHGKIDILRARGIVHAMRQDTHQVNPGMLAVANSTELGTAYKQKELYAIGQFAKDCNVRLHMDGSRLAYAMMATELPEIFRSYGFDTLMLGLTKVGALDVDVLVVADPELARAVAVYYHKQCGYTRARMQGSAVQVSAMLEDDLWLKNASRANQMAIYLRDALWKRLRVDVICPVETNALFVKVPPKAAQTLKEGGWSYIWTDPWEGDDMCVVRFMTSWATTDEHVDELVSFLDTELFRK